MAEDFCPGRKVGHINGDHIDITCETKETASESWQARFAQCLSDHRIGPADAAPKDSVKTACRIFLSLPADEAQTMESTLFGKR